jgi:hypothetical protein
MDLGTVDLRFRLVVPYPQEVVLGYSCIPPLTLVDLRVDHPEEYLPHLVLRYDFQELCRIQMGSLQSIRCWAVAVRYRGTVIFVLVAEVLGRAA